MAAWTPVRGTDHDKSIDAARDGSALVGADGHAAAVGQRGRIENEAVACRVTRNPRPGTRDPEPATNGGREPMDEEPDVAARRGERDALVGRIGAALGADGRVVAAWLGGSLGRGAADAWSDIDVWAVIEDGEMARFAAEQEAVVGAVGAPLLTLEAPQNAPPGGGYLLALYLARTGPLQVDWSWQPRSTARLPRGSRLLFDRVGIAAVASAEPERIAAEARARALSQATAAFWVAVTLAAKGVARGRGWEVVRLADWAVGSLAEVDRLLEGDGRPTPDEVRAAVRAGGWPLPGASVAAGMALLRGLCREMDARAPTIAARGGEPAVAAGRQARVLFDLVEGSVAGTHRTGGDQEAAGRSGV